MKPPIIKEKEKTVSQQHTGMVTSGQQDIFSFPPILVKLYMKLTSSLGQWDAPSVVNQTRIQLRLSLVMFNVALPPTLHSHPCPAVTTAWVSQAPQCPGSGHPPSPALPQAWLLACLLFLAAKQPGEDQDDRAAEIRTTWSSPHYLTR